MTDLRLTFIGSGNAFSPGGLCCNGFLVNDRFLFDAPPQALSSLNTVEVDPNQIDAVIVSHHHGDHFLGLPFLLLHWRWKGRTRPMKIIGPRGTQRLGREISETVFPGVFDGIGYELVWEDLEGGTSTETDGLKLSAHEMIHDSGLELCLGYKATIGGRTFSYTGDTILCDAVLELARGVEVMVSECASRADKIPVHMNLLDDIPQVRAAMEKDAELILTHITPEVTPNGFHRTRIAKDFKTYVF